MIGRLGASLAISALGQEWRLVLDANAMADAEPLLGRGVLALLPELESRDPTMTELRILMWAMLQEHHPGTDLRQAGRILSDAPDAVAKALAAQLPEPEPAPENPRQAGTAPA